MEAQYKTRSGRLVIKLVAEDVKRLFRELGAVQDAFDSEVECGCCNSVEIRYRVRDVDSNEYYELYCTNCGAKFEFGQHKKGQTLFPKTSAADGKKLPNRGWAKWSGNGNTAANGHGQAQQSDTRAGNPQSR